RRSNASGEERPPCDPPDDVRERAESRGMVLLSAGAGHVVYVTAGGDGDVDSEASLLVFDCGRHRELVFVHIPKNAGTTIEDVAQGRYIDWGRFQHNWGADTQRMPDGSACSHWHVPPYLKDPPNPYARAGTDVFCVTRDPWSRMRSEYTYTLTWTPYRATVPDGPPCSLEAFNGWVTQRLRRVESGLQPYALDCHLVPQWSFVEGPNGRRWCKEAIPIKQLTPRFNALMQAYGLPLRLAPHEKSNPSAGRCPALSSSPLEATYWASTRAIMRRVYRQDFLHLGDSMLGHAGLLVNASAETVALKAGFKDQ
ncbi:unnamed protein product, partial [Prorocentrum cordatum]